MKLPLPFIRELLRRQIDVLEYLWPTCGTLALIALAVSGTLYLVRRNRRQAICPGSGTLLIAYLAALLKLYPYGGNRLMLFSAPLWALLLGSGIAGITRLIPHRQWIAAAVVGSVALGPALGQDAFHLAHPRQKEELRPLINQVRQRYRAGDRVYVYWGAEPAFRYYWPDVPRSVVTAERYDDPLEIRAQCRAQLPQEKWERLWLIFSHAYTLNERERATLTSSLLRHARLADYLSADRAYVCLFER